MNMTEISRLIIGLREKGWSEEEINNFILWIGSGEERYMPQGDETIENNINAFFSWLKNEIDDDYDEDDLDDDDEELPF